MKATQRTRKEHKKIIAEISLTLALSQWCIINIVIYIYVQQHLLSQKFCTPERTLERINKSKPKTYLCAEYTMLYLKL
jgi:hypothetical protein